MAIARVISRIPSGTAGRSRPIKKTCRPRNCPSAWPSGARKARPAEAFPDSKIGSHPMPESSFAWHNAGQAKGAVMPQGDKGSYSQKQKRKAEHIEEGYKERGISSKEAERRA